MDPDIGTVFPEKNYYLKKDDAEEVKVGEENTQRSLYVGTTRKPLKFVQETFWTFFGY